MLGSVATVSTLIAKRVLEVSEVIDVGFYDGLDGSTPIVNPTA